MVSIEACPLFSRLGADELNALRLAAREQRYAANQEIFKEGDIGDGGLRGEICGQVQISGVVGQGTRHVFSRIGPCEIFGEMAVLENKPRSASATAEPESVVYFIPRDEML